MTQRLLLLCRANIARSAAADLLAQSVLNERWTVASGGVRALVGHPIDPVIGDVLQRRGIAVSAHRSRQATVKDLLEADLILTFESSQRAWVLAQTPRARGRALTIRRAGAIAAASGDNALEAMRRDGQAYTEVDDFADPYRRGREAAETAVDEIDSLLRVILPAIGAADIDRIQSPT